MNSFIILICNLAHPSNELPVFLATDENDQTLEFDTLEQAQVYLEELKQNEFISNVFSHAIINCSELDWI